MKSLWILIVAILGMHSSLAQTMSPLTLQQTISLPGVTGKFDHFAMDLTGGRLFAAATGNHSVEVIRLSTGKVEQSITQLGKPHGLIWDDTAHKLYIADGALAELLVYASSPNGHLAFAGKLTLSDDADDMAYDPTKHLLFVGHGGSDIANPPRIAVIDTDSLSIKANLPVSAHPEALDLDPDNQRVFANIADANQIAVVDGGEKAVSSIWKLTNAGHNVPMAYDAADRLLYVACRAPAVLLTLDAASGKEISRMATGAGADDLFYDTRLHRVYVISGAGEVDVFQGDAKGGLRSLGLVPTFAGAKTALLVPSQSRLYVGIPGTDGKSAEIRVYATGSK